MFKLVGILLLLGLSSQLVSARSNGAPSLACQSLSPWHISWTGFAKSGPPASCPFVVEAVKQESSDGGKQQKVTVTIKPKASADKFRGFVVQARLADKQDVIVDGQFVVEGTTQSFACGSGNTNPNTWTHKSADDKSSVTATWISQPGWTGSIIFHATIVQVRTTFWENQHSAQIDI